MSGLAEIYENGRSAISLGPHSHNVDSVRGRRLTHACHHSSLTRHRLRRQHRSDVRHKAQRPVLVALIRGDGTVTPCAACVLTKNGRDVGAVTVDCDNVVFRIVVIHHGKVPDDGARGVRERDDRMLSGNQRRSAHLASFIGPLSVNNGGDVKRLDVDGTANDNKLGHGRGQRNVDVVGDSGRHLVSYRSGVRLFVCTDLASMANQSAKSSKP